MTRRRRPWAAALLSLVLPGLGQLYAGHGTAAVAAYAAQVGAVALALVLWLIVPGGPVTIVAGALLAVGTFLAVSIHAWLLAARQPDAFEPKSYNRWYVYLGVYVVVGVLLGTRLQDGLKRRVEAFQIPSGAMEPTLLIGDYLFVLKTPSARTDLERGTVVVFESVEEAGLKVVKRVVGLPGDTLMMAAGALHRNGRALEEPFVIHTDPSRSEDTEQRAKMRAWQVAHEPALDAPSYAPGVQDWGPLVVPPDSFFALGDNRDASYDSRYVGFIPLSAVLGQPRVIYLSVAKDTTDSATGVRWGRLGMRVK